METSARSCVRDVKEPEGEERPEGMPRVPMEAEKEDESPSGAQGGGD